MNLLARFRTRASRLASVSTGLFVVFWLALVAAPCAMAMMAPDTGHVCPHCLPEPCHEVAAHDCDAPDLLDALRFGEQAKTMALAPPPAIATVPAIRGATVGVTSHSHSRAGPRPHLLHVQFNE